MKRITCVRKQVLTLFFLRISNKIYVYIYEHPCLLESNNNTMFNLLQMSNGPRDTSCYRLCTHLEGLGLRTEKEEKMVIILTYAHYAYNTR